MAVAEVDITEMNGFGGFGILQSDVPSGCNVAWGRERTDQLAGVQNQTRYFSEHH